MSRLFIKRLCLAGLLLIGLCALFFLGWSRVDVPAAVAPPEQAEKTARLMKRLMRHRMQKRSTYKRRGMRNWKKNCRAC